MLRSHFIQDSWDSFFFRLHADGKRDFCHRETLVRVDIIGEFTLENTDYRFAHCERAESSLTFDDILHGLVYDKLIFIFVFFCFFYLFYLRLDHAKESFNFGLLHP